MSSRYLSVKHKLFLLEQRMLRMPFIRKAYHPKRRKIAAIAWTLLVVVIVQLVLFLVLKPTQSNAAWYSGTGGKWNYRKKLTIQANMVSGSSDLTSFPVLVSMTDPDLMGTVQSTGADILFTSSDGTTKLDLELEKYTSTTGQLIAWIRIPTLSHTNNTDIYMYYGNAGATSGNTQNATGVWDTNYKGVWHLKEASGATRNDSTGNNNLGDHGTVGAGNGVIDGDGVFVRSNSNYLDKASSTGLNITSNLTVEAWGNSNDITDGTNNLLVSKDGTSSGNGGYSLRAPGSNISFRISGTGSDSFTGSGGTTLNSNTWYFFAGVYIPSTSVTVFLNGVQDGQNTTSIPASIFNCTGNPDIGSRNGG